MIRLDKVTKVYSTGKVEVQALLPIDLEVGQGEMVAIMGPSGSGKSTLMNILGCLDRPTSGSYWLDGREVARLGSNDLAEVRNQKLGFIFQSYNLLPRLTALENTELPLIYRGVSTRQRKASAMSALQAVGLSDRVSHLPSELSGGQQQRVAIARALAASPTLLLADEPTGNLDSKSGAEIMGIFKGLNQQGLTIVLVTHDEGVARHCKRIVRVRDGAIVSDGPFVETGTIETGGEVRAQ
ncbi:MAG: ABC transporter ATP-binding protein [Firmicutes bacterium]|nr:ABC transporter ATP-binding protein [Bacillota bacterium]